MSALFPACYAKFSWNEPVISAKFGLQAEKTARPWAHRQFQHTPWVGSTIGISPMIGPALGCFFKPVKYPKNLQKVKL